MKPVPEQHRLLSSNVERDMLVHLQTLAEQIRVQCSTLYKVDHKTRELILVGSQGLRTAPGYRMPIGTSLAGLAVEKERPVSIKLPAQHPRNHVIQGSGEDQYLSFVANQLNDDSKLTQGVLVNQTTDAHRTFLASEIRIIQDYVRILLPYVLDRATLTV